MSAEYRQDIIEYYYYIDINHNIHLIMITKIMTIMLSIVMTLYNIIINLI